MPRLLENRSTNTTNNKSTESASQDSASNAFSPETTKRLKLGTFPNILHRMLSEEELSEFITWLPHGCSWKIVNKNRFVDEVIPKFFNHKNYKSFLRQVNGWGFVRINKGLDEGSYYHKSFLKGEPMLARDINRPPNFKATYNRGDDPPHFTLLNEEKANRYPNVLAHFESVNRHQPPRRLHTNHVMRHNFDVMEINSLVTSTMRAGDHVLQGNVPQVVPDGHVSQRMNSSALLCLLFEYRQREIKTMIYLEEIQRLNAITLLSTCANAISNPTLGQQSAERLAPNSQIDLSACEEFVKNEEKSF